MLRGSTYTGVLFAFLGAAASTVLLSVAVLPALLWESGPYGVRAALVLVVWAGLIAAAGLARTTRWVLIAGPAACWTRRCRSRPGRSAWTGGGPRC